MNDCKDHTTVQGVETSSPVIQSHLVYIPLVTDLHNCPLIMNIEQLNNMYPECFDGIDILPKLKGTTNFTKLDAQ